MMNHSFVACEKCGSQTKMFRQGRTQGTRCTNCDWTVITTYTPPIQLDQTIYEVRIARSDYRDAEQVKAVAKVTGGNFLYARNLLKMIRPIAFTGDAQHVLQIRDSLLATGMVVAIYPEFPW